jgi:hypothetical protein
MKNLGVFTIFFLASFAIRANASSYEIINSPFIPN